MRALALVAALAACHGASPPAPPPTAPAFGLYLLALMWEPSFCCDNAGKEQCAGMPGSFGATHVTLHGLWPNYTDDEARAKHAGWPQYCGAFAHCDNAADASCAPPAGAVPADMARVGPGYVSDHDFLAVHEWSKHGSCTGLPAGDYFRAELAAMASIPGEGTPALVGAAIGHDVALADLQSGFGVPAASVVLGCDAHCRFTQVGFCLDRDARGNPTAPTACPATTTTSEYDNGCVTRGCERVAIPAAGSCDAH